MKNRLCTYELRAYYHMLCWACISEDQSSNGFQGWEIYFKTGKKDAVNTVSLRVKIPYWYGVLFLINALFLSELIFKICQPT